ncbi:sodium/glucose cotransporter 4, partial [Biomphalaria glabrata]
AEMKSEEVISAQPSRLKRYIYKWLCGYDDRPRPTLTLEDKLLMRKRMQDIGEDPLARTVNNVLAAIAIIITTFLLGYFG